MLAMMAFLIGCLAGFFGAIPIAGPVSALVFNRGLEGRYSEGRKIAYGAALAEAGYAYLVLLGFQAYLLDYPFIVPFSHAAAAIILGVLGIQFLRPSKTRNAPPSPGGTRLHVRGFLLGFTITAFNPTLIATWTAAITTLYATGLLVFTKTSSAGFAIGVCIGIAAWFHAFLFFLSRFRARFADAILHRIARIAGVLLLGLSAYFLVRLIAHFEDLMYFSIALIGVE